MVSCFVFRPDNQSREFSTTDHSTRFYYLSFYGMIYKSTRTSQDQSREIYSMYYILIQCMIHTMKILR